MGGGGFCPLVRRSPAIILWSQNFLTLSINIPSRRQSSHFFTIFTGFPEIQLRPIGDYDFLGLKTKKSNFFNFFIKTSNFISNLNDDCSQLFFEVYNVAQKLQISEFLINFLPGPWPLRRPPEAPISTSTTSIGYHILAKDLSFHMRYCLLF